ncbi:MAG: thioredoxin family protein, partial [Riemerella sp.]
EDLVIAFENLLAGQPQEELQRPSLGCNIKWK